MCLFSGHFDFFLLFDLDFFAFVAMPVSFLYVIKHADFGFVI
jgi:hypothetical protein